MLSLGYDSEVLIERRLVKSEDREPKAARSGQSSRNDSKAGARFALRGTFSRERPKVRRSKGKVLVLSVILAIRILDDLFD